MSADGHEGVEVVEVDVAPDDVDLLSGALWSAGAAAVAEETCGDRVRLRAAPGGDATAGDLADAARRWGPAAGEPPTVRVVGVADDGLDAWRAHARPWRAGQRLVVWPPWFDGAGPPVGPDDVVLRIDPGRAFGSGSHPSTRLALAAVERLVAPGDEVLDVGCGSGVLAVAAARLGARRVLALDVDPAALAATGANAAANGVGDRVEVSDRSPADVVAGGGRHDLVVANILAPVLRDLGPDLARAATPAGRVVVAGLLADQLDGVVDAVGLDLVAVDHDDGWTCAELAR